MTSRSAGDTVVRDVRVDVREDAFGDEALFVVLVLSDPPEGHESWPVDDLRALRRFVRDYLTENTPDLATPWFVVFEPEHPDLDASEDDNEQLDFDV
jgi:hypothetical protein